MAAKYLMSLLIAVTFLLAIATTVVANAQASIIVRDITGKMAMDQYMRLTEKTRLIMNNVQEYWLVDQKLETSDEILVEFAEQVHRVPSTIFFFRPENGRRVKVVRVWGGGDEPHQLAHKLTSALFPHPDKLIRNMMGEASERKFGNPLSFPMCGFGVDDWVAVLLQRNSYIPMANIGTRHADWGMEIVNAVPVIRDRKKQHASYAEAGSFGQFLLDTFGPGKMKEFHQRSRPSNRPWQEVFGMPLDELEKQWLDKVRRKAAENPAAVATLASLWGQEPRSACFQAQNKR